MQISTAALVDALSCRLAAILPTSDVFLNILDFAWVRIRLAHLHCTFQSVTVTQACHQYTISNLPEYSLS